MSECCFEVYGDQYNVELDSERIIVFLGGKVTISFANLLLGQLEHFMLFQMFSVLGMDGITAQNEFLEDFGVATIAGTSFGQRAKNNIRLSFTASDEELDEALIKNIKPGLHRKAVSTWSKASSCNNSGKRWMHCRSNPARSMLNAMKNKIKLILVRMLASLG